MPFPATVTLLIGVAACGTATDSRSADPPTVETFLQPLGRDQAAALAALDQIDQHWDNGFAAMLIEIRPFLRNRRVWQKIRTLLRHHGQQDFGDNLDRWYQWLWNEDFGVHPDYAEFKARLYEKIDPSFRRFYQDRPAATIRLDEIRWGGVRRDGIPPLSAPHRVAADAPQAAYLQDDHVVFGVTFNGESRAYPKRILAWHEMVKDTVGGESINGVYCTLCGAMIVYQTTYKGVHYELGTSGFLYRSNKLMYDHDTWSLWNTLRGEPVVGPLVGKSIRLKPLHVVTTTWGEWRQRHPETTVLSLDTGHRRDYGEGVAYRDYFATDRLMFTVPKIDTRLKNKAEVLVLRFGGADDAPTALAVAFLDRHRVHQGQQGGVSYVILTDRSGASRVYQSGEQIFKSYDGRFQVTDEQGRHWHVADNALIFEDRQLPRLPAHRAFWFGWVAVHPNTRLVK